MKFLVVFLFTVIGFQAFSQAELNEYKYIIVPQKFDGFKKENQFQTSTLIKYFFVQNGFNTVYDNALPQDLNGDRCLGLMVNLADDSSLFSTKLAIVLKDCQGNEVYRTGQGSSKSKDYKLAYREAISKAFNSLNGFTHEYTPKESGNEPVTISFKDDVKNLAVDDTTKEKAIVEVKEELPMAPSKPSEAVNEVKESVAQINNETQDEVSKAGDTRLTLYAQQTPTGYQLVDTTPSIQFYLRKTSVEGVYLASNKSKNGLVFLKDNQWVFEYYEGNKHIKEVLLIKF
jgi:hypothetical protein